MDRTVVVVTGGGRGIGRAVCERFAADGAQVVAASRTHGELEQTRQRIESAEGHCQVIPTDVCNAGEVEALIEDVNRRFGRIDVLVNCAGAAPVAKIEELDAKVFDALMAVCVGAVYRACRAVWPIMRRQGGGVVVNFSSVSSVDPFAGFAAYEAAKAWVNAWTRALADEGRPVGIRVFAVATGAVETRMLRDAFPDYPAEQALQPADVAEVVYSIAQSGCRYASGQTIFVKK